MKKLLFFLICAISFSYSQSVTVQKCPSSALEEVSFVSVSLDSTTQLQTIVTRPEQESTTLPKPIDAVVSPLVQPVSGKVED